eukprot:NODE_16370_length_998_cov_3.746269.p1 GENE.NODE_16370_length_998_cov_3.746269~~NODE_16370_length_998_cov_3.746269.p1  ORF type:complete len:147 (-),score=6.94 NODE_16370_length_998_cov_3.746269:216-656(-)
MKQTSKDVANMGGNGQKEKEPRCHRSGSGASAASKPPDLTRSSAAGSNEAEGKKVRTKRNGHRKSKKTEIWGESPLDQVYSPDDSSVEKKSRSEPSSESPSGSPRDGHTTGGHVQSRLEEAILDGTVGEEGGTEDTHSQGAEGGLP